MLPSTAEHSHPIHARPVVIVGMHRSGTSCLAGCLEQLGLHLGNVITSSPHNEKGNRENPELWPIHDAILGRCGAAWDAPPEGIVPWTTKDRTAVLGFLERYRGITEPWGFKDPRVTLLLDGWMSVVPGLRLVASFRHPVAVARSLAARNGLSEERSLFLWERYNREVLRWHSRTGCLLVDYDDPDYEHAVRRIAARLCLEADRPLTFRSGDLNHHRLDEPPPESVAAVWHELLEAARP